MKYKQKLKSYMKSIIMKYNMILSIILLCFIILVGIIVYEVVLNQFHEISIDRIKGEIEKDNINKVNLGILEANKIEKSIEISKNGIYNFFEKAESIKYFSNIKFEKSNEEYYYKVDNDGGSGVFFLKQPKNEKLFFENINKMEYMDAIMKTNVLNNVYIRAIYYLSEERVLRRYPYTDVLDDMSYHVMQLNEQNFKENKDGNQLNNFIIEKNEEDILLFFPIYVDTKYKGILCFDIDVRKLVGDTFSEEDKVVIVKNNTGLMHVKDDLFNNGICEYKDCFSEFDYDNTYIEYQGKNLHVGIKDLGFKDFSLIILTNVSELFEREVLIIENMFRTILEIFVVTYIIILVLLSLFKKKMYKSAELLSDSLEELSKKTQDFSNTGNVIKTDIETGLYEIDMLAVELYKMTKSIVKNNIQLQNEERKTEAAYKEIQKYQEKLTIDPLTKTYNRIKVDEVLDYEIKRSNRYNISFSILLLDIDKFKGINDTYGHNRGDEVLKTFASILKSGVRETDVVARWGGDEFVIILPWTTRDEAIKIAEKLRLNVSNAVFEGQIKVTTSIGVSEYHHGDNIRDMVLNADKALYDAKNNGKNKVS